MPLLDIRDLRIDFGSTRVVDGVSLSLAEGGCLALVGESGCGKSVTALSIARLLPTPPARYAAGEIALQGRDVLRMTPAELRAIRGGVVSYVFQEPGASLNPVLRVGAQIRETLRLHRPREAGETEVVRLLKQVGIPAPEQRTRDYPHQLSGGMQQRVMIAMALAAAPKLLVADEPTTALDVTIQAQIIELLAELRRQLGMAILLITHNLGIVGDLADRVAVMYAGQIVEEAATGDLLRRPLHPYTQALLRSAPILGREQDRLEAIPGTVPVPGQWPAGCRFAPRCPMARSECREQVPVLAPCGGDRLVRCPFVET
ncbi:MAG: ABC transporter ATP-binding protein [Verrucomicrobia bacterium]|nr:ABC transporter ATP-binding protein [Verrucomicrobiota bacterium]